MALGILAILIRAYSNLESKNLGKWGNDYSGFIAAVFNFNAIGSRVFWRKDRKLSFYLVKRCC
ncbi:hypothetical protein D9M68_620580 [compost metagenome]